MHIMKKITNLSIYLYIYIVCVYKTVHLCGGVCAHVYEGQKSILNVIPPENYIFLQKFSHGDMEFTKTAKPHVSTYF